MSSQEVNGDLEVNGNIYQNGKNIFDLLPFKSFQAYGSLDVPNGGVRGYAQYIRLAPKKGILNLSFEVPTIADTPENHTQWFIVSLNQLSTLLGVNFKTTGNPYETGQWEVISGGDRFGFNFGNACRVHETAQGWISFGRRHTVGGAYGNWSISDLQEQTYNAHNIYVEEI